MYDRLVDGRSPATDTKFAQDNPGTIWVYINLASHAVQGNTSAHPSAKHVRHGCALCVLRLLSLVLLGIHVT